MEKLANMLREARTLKGKSLRNFAVDIKISPSYISLIERGDISPSPQALRKICQALDLDYDECLKETKAYKKVFS